MYAANSAITAYSNTGMETGVFSADPHKLILLLFEGASLAISSALGHMARNEVAQKGRSISHAIAIINKGLQASLDMKAGGEIAQNLFDLYDYMTRRLLHANLNNDPDALREGYRAGQARYRRPRAAGRFVRKWLQLRHQALGRSREVSDTISCKRSR